MEYRTHTCGELKKEDVGKNVKLSGWVHRRRDLGGLIFVDLRDRYGITQIVFNPDKIENFKLVEKLKYEFIIKIEGEVLMRDEKNVNNDLGTGEVEVIVLQLEVLSEAKTMPFEIFDTKKEEDEELRLKYRFLELRREKLKNNILFRAKMEKHIRDYMDSRGFINISTPILTVSSPEGARDFLVPSRIHPGKFYALPQAPQQYKQLLMVAGFDKYYQIAPCMRDEDPRADRSPGEFYQLDVETSFTSQDEFFEMMEPLFVELTELAGKKVINKKFPRIIYKDAMNKYGSDRPDLRFGIEIQDITEWGNKTEFNVFASAEIIKVLVVEGGNKFTRKEIDEDFTDIAKRNHAKGLAWMKLVDGVFEGSVVKFFKETELEDLKRNLNLENDSILFFVADKWKTCCESLGAVRNLVAEKMGLADINVIAWAWIVDFPMYEWDEKNQKIDFGHNPFSMPQGGIEGLNAKDPLDILAYQYDIVANGLELSSGAVRNKDPQIMYKAFEVAGYSKEEVNKKFGHMINAFEYGAPPHCGFAPGIERMAMLLLGEKNLRAVIAFPKNQKAEEVMLGSPAEVSEEQLRELSLKLDKKG
ncbi:MAG: aspartate--tRNA ligase [Candidatus Magasanikbacteria bacterium CG_4_9_14_3_um_filter_32_9]|uniref:Aspartate--tRNA ligase n=1 Tax=Candidatus Magasanikbacteria bacterium CG_4_9_14_3_um_filter_32_9 TaxID=1974644 RepID=A0A2M7Z667_9BACT|nr:MAG: aspartate--tRNA ligase [Candidatus Magasanikbacteria bacterium CG_4_9_14_3_um_filter_32_9]